MELIDAAYNRWSFDRDDTLPVWFTEDEEKHNKPMLPITKELMAEFKAKMKEINARPIRKVAEAKARKARRLKLRLEKIRQTAQGLADAGDMTEKSRARAMRSAMAKNAKAEKRQVTVVAIKKGGGGNMTGKGKVAKGAKTKVVDKRMKSDMRGLKKAHKRNPQKAKKEQRKINSKMAKRGNLKR